MPNLSGITQILIELPVFGKQIQMPKLLDILAHIKPLRRSMFLEEEQYICKNYINPIKTLFAIWPFPVYIHGKKLQNLPPVQLNYKGLLEKVCVQ